MECILEAHPVPDITWYQGEKTCVDSPRIKMSRKATSKDTYVLTLEINDPKIDDGGNYRCNAFNAYGESNANIALNFQGNNGKCFRVYRSIKLEVKRLKCDIKPWLCGWELGGVVEKHKQPALARLFLQMSCLRASVH